MAESLSTFPLQLEEVKRGKSESHPTSRAGVISSEASHAKHAKAQKAEVPSNRGTNKARVDFSETEMRRNDPPRSF